MAYVNKSIQNPKSGQEIVFVNTAATSNGKLLEMISTYQAGSSKPAPHYHPEQEENFKIISGELTVEIDGQTKILKQGDSIQIPKNTPHSMWNSSHEKTVVNWKVQPALDTENLLENAMGLARDNKVSEKGVPNILQTALLVNKFAHVYRVAHPPFVIQKILFAILTPVAYLLGYRSSYQEYVD